MCQLNKLDVQDFLLETAASTDEELALAALECFQDQGLFTHQFEFSSPVSDLKECRFLKLVMKELRGQPEEQELAADLLARYVDFGAGSPFA